MKACIAYHFHIRKVCPATLAVSRFGLTQLYHGLLRCSTCWSNMLLTQWPPVQQWRIKRRAICRALWVETWPCLHLQHEWLILSAEERTHAQTYNNVIR